MNTRNATMAKNAYINARVDKRVKARAQKVLGTVGMSTTDAINLFLHQIVLHKGLPFDVRIPNKETIEAMREIESGGGTVHKGSTKQILQEIIESDD